MIVIKINKCPFSLLIAISITKDESVKAQALASQGQDIQDRELVLLSPSPTALHSFQEYQELAPKLD